MSVQKGLLLTESQVFDGARLILKYLHTTENEALQTVSWDEPIKRRLSVTFNSGSGEMSITEDHNREGEVTVYRSFFDAENPEIPREVPVFCGGFWEYALVRFIEQAAEAKTLADGNAHIRNFSRIDDATVFPEYAMPPRGTR